MRRLYAATAAVWLLSGCSQSPEKAAKDARDAAASAVPAEPTPPVARP